MKTVEAYQASDGKLFFNRLDCEKHEKILDPRSNLVKHIAKYCPATGEDDNGCSIYDDIDIANYIIDNFRQIEKMHFCIHLSYVAGNEKN